MKSAINNKLGEAEKRILLKNLLPSVKAFYTELLFKDWRIYVVSSRRGWCKYKTKEISIPLWAVLKGSDYANWYVAHEMSHAFVYEAGYRNEQHGQVFMTFLKNICPAEFLHLELGYKPRNANSAGISQFAVINKISAKQQVIQQWEFPEDF